MSLQKKSVSNNKQQQSRERKKCFADWLHDSTLHRILLTRSQSFWPYLNEPTVFHSINSHKIRNGKSDECINLNISFDTQIWNHFADTSCVSFMSDACIERNHLRAARDVANMTTGKLLAKCNNATESKPLASHMHTKARRIRRKLFAQTFFYSVNDGCASNTRHKAEPIRKAFNNLVRNCQVSRCGRMHHYDDDKASTNERKESDE